MAVLMVVSVAQFLIALDYSIVYLALPSITRALGLPPALAQGTTPLTPPMGISRGDDPP